MNDLQFVSIPQLPIHTPPLTGEELLILVQEGVDRKIELSSLKDFVNSSQEGEDYQSQIDKINQQLMLFIQHEPTTTDKSWTFNDNVYPFLAGQVVIYNDTSANRLSYYAFRGISGEDAVWQLLNPVVDSETIDVNKINGIITQATGIVTGSFANVLMKLTQETSISCTEFSDGQQVQVLIVNTVATPINVTIPATGDYILLGYSADRVVTLQPNADIELNIWYVNGKFRLKTIE